MACIRPHPKIVHRQSVQLIDLLEVPLAERGIEPDLAAVPSSSGRDRTG